MAASINHVANFDGAGPASESSELSVPETELSVPETGLNLREAFRMDHLNLGSNAIQRRSFQCNASPKIEVSVSPAVSLTGKKAARGTPRGFLPHSTGGISLRPAG
jgi:hypothetical protein